MQSMSGGAWSYNRFDAYEKKLSEASKPDYLDFDGDGDKKEPMKKALKEKGKKKEVKEGKGELPDFIKDKMKDGHDKEHEKDDKKKSKKKDDDCECKEAYEVSNADKKGNTPDYQGYKAGKKNAKTGEPLYKKGKGLDEGSGCGYQEGGEVKAKKAKKDKVIKEDVLEWLMENSLANNEVSAEVLFNHISDEFLESIEEDIMELYVGKHGQTEKEYQDGRSNAGKMISGDSKGSGANYSYKAKNTGTNPAGGSQKPQGQAKMNNKDRAYLQMQKANMKK